MCFTWCEWAFEFLFFLIESSHRACILSSITERLLDFATFLFNICVTFLVQFISTFVFQTKDFRNEKSV